LSSLTVEQLRFVEAELSSNEVSSDEQMHGAFVAAGLTEAQAIRALQYRSRYLQRMYLEGHTPIRKGDDALHYNPGR
jgi:hypothetical protein